MSPARERKCRNAEIVGGMRSPERRRITLLLNYGLELATLNIKHVPMFVDLESPFPL